MRPTAFAAEGRQGLCRLPLPHENFCHGGGETEELSRVFHTASPRRPTGFRYAAAVAYLVIGLPLAGCSFFQAQSTTRGDPVDVDAIKQLTPGTTTSADVTALLGSPTARETFDDNTWIYISQITRPRVGRLPGVLQQRVVVLNFDAGGVLRALKVYDKADGKDVSMAPETTPTPGASASVLQQLFGNIGRFSGAGNDTGGTQGGGGMSGGGLSGGGPGL
jgi:outer membrane protein assembly factor BamE (lipoprotein component of BamABCDE complex)